MKVNDLIEKLNYLKKEYGDNLNVIVSSDEEGNSFCALSSGFSLSMVFDRDTSKPIGICIFPFSEEYESPDAACRVEEK